MTYLAGTVLRENLKVRWPKRRCLLNSETADLQRVMVPFENVMKATITIFNCTNTLFYLYTNGVQCLQVRIPALSKGNKIKEIFDEKTFSE